MLSNTRDLSANKKVTLNAIECLMLIRSHQILYVWIYIDIILNYQIMNILLILYSQKINHHWSKQ